MKDTWREAWTVRDREGDETAELYYYVIFQLGVIGANSCRLHGDGVREGQ